MNQLYPLKFTPILLDKMWGGSKLKNILDKATNSDKAGESWEISGVEGNVSVVSNGNLEGNDLNDLMEVYMGDLVGERVFEKFGTQFPLLIKYIDANDVLSIQVHPDDELAFKRHNSFGKTEMWYVMQAEKGSELIVGFNQKLDKETYLNNLNNKTLTDILNKEPVKEGDVFFLPAGRVHAIGAGILLAEIQQTSDVTYRIYDFDRKESNGKYRELHTEQALDSIDYTFHNNYRTEYPEKKNSPVNIVNCEYFTTNLLNLTSSIEKDILRLDCFVIYMCLEGSCIIGYNEKEKIELSKGETILIPAELTTFTIEPGTSVKLLEVYIPDNSEKDSKIK
jgi:mannose-6-phosphate isomerase